MKRVFLFLGSLLAALPLLQAQPVSLAVSAIPDSLKKNASVVKRVEEIFFDVSNIGEARETIHQIYTIMNDNGKDHLLFYEYSDKFRILDDAEIRVYDASGSQTARYKQKDMITRAGSENLVDDGKYTLYRVSAPSYPITVEFTYSIRHKGILRYPYYYIQMPEESIESSTYSVSVPGDLDIRYKNKNTAIKPVRREDGKKIIYTWQAHNRPAFDYEPGSIGQYPYVMLAPNRFKFDNLPGDLSSWKNYGAWYYNLYKGLDELPPDRVQYFNTLVSTAKTTREKIEILYDYLQKNFRYVSIQLGIGGLKPFSASFTDQKKYGDCKALTNFMCAALKAVGIKSYSAIINAGTNGTAADPAFPSEHFNHVILCVPQPGDSIWLECTSTISDFGVLGDFTENRNALLITENGGVLVPTPRSRMENNHYSATSRVTIADDGSGTTQNRIVVKGEFKDMMVQNLVNEKSDDQKKFIVYSLEYKQPDEFSVTTKDTGRTLDVSIAMSFEKVPEFTAGNKMFLAPRLYKLWSSKLPKSDQRKTDFYFRHPFVQTDTTIYLLPEGFQSDALPDPVHLENDYASYDFKTRFDADQRSIISTSALTLKDQHIPAQSYPQVKAFFDKVMMEEGRRIVIRKD